MNSTHLSTPIDELDPLTLSKAVDPSRPPRGLQLPDLTVQLRPYFEAAGRQPNTFRQNYNLLLNGAFPGRKWRGAWYADASVAEVAALLGLSA